MELKGKGIWQVGAGDTEHSYGKIFVKYDLMAIGPGDDGLYDEKKYAYLGDIRNSIHRFYQNAKKNDIVILRLGTSRVLAVGLIADDKPSLMQEFGDVDGWHLQHVRRVRWLPGSEKEFPLRTLGGQVRTFAGVNVHIVQNWIKNIGVSRESLQRELKRLPKESTTISDKKLGEQLFLEGLPSEYIDNLIVRLESIRRVASWYENEEKQPKGRPSEQETITYLVMPLLSALGWSHQTTAIEWRNVDIALFEQMPSDDATLSCVIEVKSLNRSVFSSLGQAKDYATGKGRNHCKRLVVTDGIRYAYFKKRANDFELCAYLNIQRMRKEYPIYSCGGAVEAIMGMAK